MGLLQGPSLPAFKQAVISLWFRVPQEAIDAAKAAGDVMDAMAETGPQYPPLYRTVPLLTFGAPYGTIQGTDGSGSETVHTTTYNSRFYDVQTDCSMLLFTPTPHQLNDVRNKSGASYPMPSCYIGVRVAHPNDDDQNNKLAFYVQYPDLAHTEWFSWYASYAADAEESILSQSGLSATCGYPTYTLGGQTIYVVPGKSPFHETITFKDQSSIIQDWQYGKEHIGNYPAVVGVDAINVSPDAWHHLLLSFDFSGSISAHGLPVNVPPGLGTISSNCKLWVALDDVNYTGTDLPATWVGKLSGRGDPNTVVTPVANLIQNFGMFGSFPDPNPVHSITDNAHWVVTYTGGGTPLYSYTVPNIPAGPLGIPATSDVSDNIYKCEMAEFQMWTGETLDTSNESARRAFLDVKRDTLGQPVPVNGIIGWMPVNPKSAAKLIGRKQDVQLTTTSNWQQGKNTGASGTPFRPAGTIKPYPDPIIPLGT